MKPLLVRTLTRRSASVCIAGGLLMHAAAAICIAVLPMVVLTWFVLDKMLAGVILRSSVPTVWISLILTAALIAAMIETRLLSVLRPKPQRTFMWCLLANVLCVAIATWRTWTYILAHPPGD